MMFSAEVSYVHELHDVEDLIYADVAWAQGS